MKAEGRRQKLKRLEIVEQQNRNNSVGTNFKKFDAQNKKTTDHFWRVKFEVVGDEDGPEELHAELPDEAADLSKGGLVVLETNHGPL